MPIERGGGVLLVLIYYSKLTIFMALRTIMMATLYVTKVWIEQ